MMWWYPDGGPFGWVAMLIGMILIAVVIVAVVWAVIRLAGQVAGARPDASLHILRERSRGARSARPSSRKPSGSLG